MKTRHSLVLLCVLSAACGGEAQPPTEAPNRPPVAVRTVAATLGDTSDALEAGGVVRARTSATLVSRIVAPVVSVRVKPGDRVREGQVLVTLDDRDLGAHVRRAGDAVKAGSEAVRASSAELEAAQASRDLAQATHTRMSTLHERRSATAQEFDQSQAALRGAEARVAAATARVREAEASVAALNAAQDAAVTVASFANITAPFDGLVTEKLVEPGNMASPGMALVRIEDVRGLRLEVRVDESRAPFLTVGVRVPVLLGDAQVPVEGTVSELARAIDADARAVLVKIDLPSGSGVSGAFGRAVLPGASRRALSIPVSAVVRNGQLTSVFVADGGRATLRLITVGPELNDRIEVLAGLTDGESVVVSPPPGLVDGAPITVAGAAASTPGTDVASAGGRP
ncbi:MAG: efflux RND transporter periplasmic adaptor subunit [Vicinamibacterales bacterium]